ncbi:MAG: hypothetical protein IH901_05605 [Proteobacteria bacterium]|nr:hypothetical protein [Pseudomonadota bacterium]
MFWFFSNKVANVLVKMSHEPAEIMSMGGDNFTLLCKGLKTNGYDKYQAAGLFHRFFANDPDAFYEMLNNTGIYGPIILKPMEPYVKDWMKEETD